MTTSPKHSLQLEGDIHISYQWAYANAAARTGASGFTTDDIGKLALQQDNNTLWMLTAVTPTWVAVSGGATAFTGLTDTPSSYSGYGGYALAVNVGETAVEFVAFPSGTDHTTEDAATATITDVVSMRHNSTGTPAAGFGTGIIIQGETTTTENTAMARIAARWQDATHATRYSALVISTYRAGVEFYSGVLVAPTTVAGVYTGNARARGSVDLQVLRFAADQVAGGDYSAIIGGFSNKVTANGDNSGILAGVYNTIGAYGLYSATIGGYYTTVNARYAASLAANRGLADKRGQIVRTTGRFAATGDSQASDYTLRRQVTHSDTNWYELFLDGTSERLTIASDQALVFVAYIVGATSGQVKTFGFKIEGVIENDGGTTTLLASTVTTLYDTDDVSFDARASADDTNDALLIEVTDADGASDVVRWSCTLEAVELTYA